MFMNYKIYHFKDVSSPQIDLYIQTKFKMDFGGGVIN